MMKELDLCIRELREASQLLSSAVDSLVALFSGNAGETQLQPETITLEQVRAVLADKSQAGFTAEVRGLLERYGAAKLSNINPKHYAALMADAEGLR
jgi:hypothetical protein